MNHRSFKKLMALNASIKKLLTESVLSVINRIDLVRIDEAAASSLSEKFTSRSPDIENFIQKIISFIPQYTDNSSEFSELTKLVESAKSNLFNASADFRKFTKFKQELNIEEASTFIASLRELYESLENIQTCLNTWANQEKQKDEKLLETHTQNIQEAIAELEDSSAWKQMKAALAHPTDEQKLLNALRDLCGNIIKLSSDFPFVAVKKVFTELIELDEDFNLSLMAVQTVIGIENSLTAISDQNYKSPSSNHMAEVFSAFADALHNVEKTAKSFSDFSERCTSNHTYSTQAFKWFNYPELTFKTTAAFDQKMKAELDETLKDSPQVLCGGVLREQTRYVHPNLSEETNRFILASFPKDLEIVDSSVEELRYRAGPMIEKISIELGVDKDIVGSALEFSTQLGYIRFLKSIFIDVDRPPNSLIEQIKPYSQDLVLSEKFKSDVSSELDKMKEKNKKVDTYFDGTICEGKFEKTENGGLQHRFCISFDSFRLSGKNSLALSLKNESPLLLVEFVIDVAKDGEGDIKPQLAKIDIVPVHPVALKMIKPEVESSLKYANVNAIRVSSDFIAIDNYNKSRGLDRLALTDGKHWKLIISLLQQIRTFEISSTSIKDNLDKSSLESNIQIVAQEFLEVESRKAFFNQNSQLKIVQNILNINGNSIEEILKIAKEKYAKNQQNFENRFLVTLEKFLSCETRSPYDFISEVKDLIRSREDDLEKLSFFNLPKKMHLKKQIDLLKKFIAVFSNDKLSSFDFDVNLYENFIKPMRKKTVIQSTDTCQVIDKLYEQGVTNSKDGAEPSIVEGENPVVISTGDDKNQNIKTTSQVDLGDSFTISPKF